MTPPSDNRNVFVWAWLPGHTEPVVAGRLHRSGDIHHFIYGRSYLDRKDAISLFEPELPLRAGWIEPLEGLSVAGCLDDGKPDSWGRRVIIARLTGKKGGAIDAVDIDETTVLLESGSNRIGGLDFQKSATTYEPRDDDATLDELHRAADALLQGEELSPALAEALVHGTAVGGARPKILVKDGDTHMIAKLSLSTDTYPMVKAEAAAMELARRVGIDAPRSRIVTSLGRQVLLVERFDRPGNGERRMMVSGLTMQGLDSFLGSRYSSYPDMLDALLARSADPASLGRAVFARIVFNIAIGNIDDHARNHAAFWDGEFLELTPAYDLCPQLRSSETAKQAMDIDRDGMRDSQFALCVAAAHIYGLSKRAAREIIERQVEIINDNWSDVADLAQLTTTERNALWGRQILNPYASYDFGFKAGTAP